MLLPAKIGRALRKWCWRKWAFAIVLTSILWTAASVRSTAQLPKATSPPAKAEPATMVDPLRRETPRSTVEGLLRCGEREDFACIARYLQPAPGLNVDSMELAREFHALRSRYKGSIATLSDDPNGRVEEGLPPGQERAGVVQIGGTTTPIILVRVDDPNYGKIWLVSGDTVAWIPQLYTELQNEKPRLAQRMTPAALADFSGNVAGAVAGMAALDPDFGGTGRAIGVFAECAETNLARESLFQVQV